MAFIKRVLSGVHVGIFLSALVHAGLGGGLYYALTVPSTPPIVAELDLSMMSLRPVSPLPPPPPGSGSKPTAEAAPGPARTVAKRRAAAVSPPSQETPPRENLPSPVVSEFPSEVPEPSPSEEVASAVSSGEIQENSETGSAAEEAVSVAAAGLGAPGGTPEGQPGGAPEGSPDSAGRYLSASEVARPPRWVGNLIGPGDYPRTARRKGKDGKVLLSVFIDEAGRVRDVRLLQGSDEALNEAALRKVREGIFTPAYNEDGKSVACRVTLPIRFHLE